MDTAADLRNAHVNAPILGASLARCTLSRLLSLGGVLLVAPWRDG